LLPNLATVLSCSALEHRCVLCVALQCTHHQHSAVEWQPCSTEGVPPLQHSPCPKTCCSTAPCVCVCVCFLCPLWVTQTHTPQSLYSQVVEGIASARRLAPAAVEAAVNASPLLPSQAMQLKLLDALAYRWVHTMHGQAGKPSVCVCLGGSWCYGVCICCDMLHVVTLQLLHVLLGCRALSATAAAAYQGLGTHKHTARLHNMLSTPAATTCWCLDDPIASCVREPRSSSVPLLLLLLFPRPPPPLIHTHTTRHTYNPCPPPPPFQGPS
jgi:hypothetical protein